MKRILIVCHAWHEEIFGGAFKLAWEFAQYLADSGYEVFFLCGTEQTDYSNPTWKSGIQIWRYRFPRSASPGIANLSGHLYRSYSLTRHIFRRFHIDYLNAHSPLQFLGACHALKHNNCQKVYSVHSPFVEELKANWGTKEIELPGSTISSKPYQKFHVSWKHRMALGAARILEKMIYHQADKIQCYSEYSLSLISAQYPREVCAKGVVCPGWVDMKRFIPVDNQDEIREKLGFPWRIGVTTFLSVRRLEKRMGLDNLIAACGILKNEGYDFQLLIGGMGPLQNELEDEISRLGLRQCVYLLGRISEKDLPLTYAAADCFVLPTRSLECFGLIVLESFACNTPVIATPVGAIPEVMGTYGKQGWLSIDTSANAIADRMRMFLKDGIKINSDGLRCHATQYVSSNSLSKLKKIACG